MNIILDQLETHSGLLALAGVWVVFVGIAWGCDVWNANVELPRERNEK